MKFQAVSKKLEKIRSKKMCQKERRKKNEEKMTRFLIISKISITITIIDRPPL